MINNVIDLENWILNLDPNTPKDYTLNATVDQDYLEILMNNFDVSGVADSALFFTNEMSQEIDEVVQLVESGKTYEALGTLYNKYALIPDNESEEPSPAPTIPECMTVPTNWLFGWATVCVTLPTCFAKFALLDEDCFYVGKCIPAGPGVCECRKFCIPIPLLLLLIAIGCIFLGGPILSAIGAAAIRNLAIRAALISGA